jgi:hypothetical protein
MSITYATLQNTLFPAAVATPQTLRKSSDGVLESYGKSVPAEGVSGYVPGCIFIKTDGSGDNVLYVNEGTATSASFRSMKNVPNAYGTAAGRGPSPLIWDNCPVLDYTLNPQLGMHYFTDFLDGIVVASTQNTAAAAALGTTGDWAAFTAANPTITTLTTTYNGVVRLFATDDNKDVAIAYPKTAHTAGMFKLVAGKKLWMEMRIAQNTVGDSEFTSWLGFCEEGLLAAGTLLLINEAGMADKDYVGFIRIFADGNALDTTYNTESSAGPIILGSDAVAAVAGTFIKLGIYCDGTTVYFYADGVRLADSVLLSATAFPDDIDLALYIGVMGAVGDADAYIDVDWVRIAQEW